ncbi:MAG: L-rhamnose mutarotase [Alphaproteobacteria bacterium]|nr:L-rhamnose mutarotase [Alphaproteobacteria bacterium]
MIAGSEFIAFGLRLRPGSEAEYKRRHDAIWPEMRDALLGAGILHYEIHLNPTDGMLFAFILRRRDHGMEHLPESEVFHRWQAHMADILLPTNGQLRVPLERMFVLSAEDQAKK